MKVALVTGASKGLGFEWCRQLGEKGYTVLLTARKLNDAQEASAILKAEGLDVHPLAVDVTKEDELKALAHQLDENFGKLDVLINNAGINSGTRAKGNEELRLKNIVLEVLDPNEVLNMLYVNAIAPILVAKHLKGLLAKSEQAKIIQIGSWLGSIEIKTTGANYSYAVSKSALNMMNRALAFDLKPDGVISVVVNPGWVQTSMGGQKAQFTTEESVQNLIENVLEKVELEDTGKFFNYDGSIHPW